jgi:hypothetical protein
MLQNSAARGSKPVVKSIDITWKGKHAQPGSGAGLGGDNRASLNLESCLCLRKIDSSYVVRLVLSNRRGERRRWGGEPEPVRRRGVAAGAVGVREAAGGANGRERRAEGTAGRALRPGGGLAHGVKADAHLSEGAMEESCCVRGQTARVLRRGVRAHRRDRFSRPLPLLSCLTCAGAAAAAAVRAGAGRQGGKGAGAGQGRQGGGNGGEQGGGRQGAQEADRQGRRSVINTRHHGRVNRCRHSVNIPLSSVGADDSNKENHPGAESVAGTPRGRSPLCFSMPADWLSATMGAELRQQMTRLQQCMEALVATPTPAAHEGPAEEEGPLLAQLRQRLADAEHVIMQQENVGWPAGGGTCPVEYAGVE